MQTTGGRAARWAVWLTSALVLSPVLYALSIGPAVWLQGHGFIHPDTTKLLFAPLVWICESPARSTTWQTHISTCGDIYNVTPPV